MKLQKLIAESGYCSRRKAEALIEAKRVYVDGKLATTGMRVRPQAKVTIDNNLLDHSIITQSQLLIYNKPPGVMCTRSDPEGRPTVFDDLPDAAWGRWVMIGRLDFHTQGLLLFTNDGEIANEMMHPRFECEREYRVRVIGDVTDDMIQQLCDGVKLDDGVARFERIKRSESAGGKNQWFQVMLKEGRNRIVRRLFESQNVTVSRLIRVRFGDYKLPRDLPQGEWRLVDIER